MRSLIPHTRGGVTHVTSEPTWVATVPDALDSERESHRTTSIHERARGCHLDVPFCRALQKVKNPHLAHQLEEWQMDIACMELVKMSLSMQVKVANDPCDAVGNLVLSPITCVHANEWHIVNDAQLKLQEKFMDSFLVVLESCSVTNVYKTSDLEEVLFEDGVVALTKFHRDVCSVKWGLAQNSHGRGHFQRDRPRRPHDRGREHDRDRNRSPPRRQSRLHDYLTKDGKPRCKRAGYKGIWDAFRGCSDKSCTRPKPRQFDRDRGGGGRI